MTFSEAPGQNPPPQATTTPALRNWTKENKNETKSFSFCDRATPPATTHPILHATHTRSALPALPQEHSLLYTRTITLYECPFFLLIFFYSSTMLCKVLWGSADPLLLNCYSLCYATASHSLCQCPKMKDLPVLLAITNKYCHCPAPLKIPCHCCMFSKTSFRSTHTPNTYLI